MTTVPSIQIAIDCSDAHALARFWAEALSYEMEVDTEQIRSVLEAGYASEDDVIELDGELQWRTAAACRDPHGTGPRIIFQQVPEPKTVKDRIHLDLHYGNEQRDAQVGRLIGLGATWLWEAAQGPHSWVTLADPEGNEFCVL